MPCPFFFFLGAIHADVAPSQADARRIGSIHADSGRIGPYRLQPPILAPNRPIQVEIQKKKNKNKRCETQRLAEIKKIKKRCKMHRLDKNNKTLYLRPQSAALSHFSLLIFSSLSLSGLYAPRHGSLPLLSISPRTQSHTHTISLTTSLTRRPTLKSQAQVSISSFQS